MKIKMIMLSLFAAVATLSGCKDKDDQQIQPSNLPAPAQSFIHTHFDGAQYVAVTVDREFTETTYDVILTNGVKLEFDGKGLWKEVEGPVAGVPMAIIPSQIRDYVAEKYPGAIIVKISRDRRDYEVDLSNGVELKFDAKRLNVIHIDTEDFVGGGAGQGVAPKVDESRLPLPTVAKAFIAEHFKGLEVIFVEADREYNGVGYDVILSDRTRLEFDHRGEWEEVETHTYAVPAGIIPGEIRRQVEERFPHAIIVKISRDSIDYEVELSNGFEVTFDAGTFRITEIDD